MILLMNDQPNIIIIDILLLLLILLLLRLCVIIIINPMTIANNVYINIINVCIINV